MRTALTPPLVRSHTDDPCAAAMAGGHTAPRVELTEEQQAALEKANETLVTNFVNDYATRDADVISKYVSDDIAYQITPGIPDIVGREAFHKHNANMFQGYSTVTYADMGAATATTCAIDTSTTATAAAMCTPLSTDATHPPCLGKDTI